MSTFELYQGETHVVAAAIYNPEVYQPLDPNEPGWGPYGPFALSAE